MIILLFKLLIISFSSMISTSIYCIQVSFILFIILLTSTLLLSQMEDLSSLIMLLNIFEEYLSLLFRIFGLILSKDLELLCPEEMYHEFDLTLTAPFV